MSAIRSQTQSPQRVDETNDLPPPYTPHATDELTLEVGPSRTFQRTPQQPRPFQVEQRQSGAHSGGLSDFAREFYAAGGGQSRSAESLPQQPPPRHHQAQNSIPDDGRPTRTPVPGHPLLNNGKTLVYPAGYECHKCHNSGFKSYDPSNPCRKCWEKYSKPYSGPIVYSSWGPGPSNRQRPLLNLRSSATGPSLSRSISSAVNQFRNDLSSYPGTSPWRSFSPPPSRIYPSRNNPVPPPLPTRPQSSYNTMTTNNFLSSTRPRACMSPSIVQPGDPRIGGRLCWNCLGSGRTFGFLLLSDKTCNVCGGVGRLL